MPSLTGGVDAGWKTAALFILTLLVFAVCGLILYPFVPAITGAIVIATVTCRPFHWWRARLPSRTAAAASSLLVVGVSLIAPVLLLTQYLVRHALAGAEWMRQGQFHPGLDALVHRYPQLARALERNSELIAFGDMTQKLAGYVSTHLVGFLSNSLGLILQSVVMLFILFFLYRDEEAAVGFLARILPLRDAEIEPFMRRLRETVRATVLGALLVAAAQGVVAGVVFALLGMRSAVILGLLTAVAGLVPPLGAFIVWMPVATWFALTGHWIQMSVLLVVGSLVISTLDNFLYPVLVGSQLRQHTVPVFLALLGGVWLFGISGVVIGPVAFSAADALLAVWKTRSLEAQPASLEPPRAP